MQSNVAVPYLSLASNLFISFLRNRIGFPHVFHFPDSPSFARHGILSEFQTKEEEEGSTEIILHIPT